MFRIFHLDECTTRPLEPARGEKIELVDTAVGTEKLDVHLNRLVPGGPRGRLHHHTHADNVYIVKRGEGALEVEGRRHAIRENDVVYIPAGTKHSLSNVGTEPFELFEIYAPAGAQLDFVRDE